MGKIINHWGVYTDADVPTTGVVHNNDAEWLHEEIAYNSIDLEHEEAWQMYQDDRESFFCYYDIEDQEDFDFDDWSSMWDTSQSTLLLGSWKKIDGQYEPDESGEYSAIRGEIYTQVVYSQYVTRASLCSPCYPGQGDIGSDGEQLTYTLPPEIWGERLSKEELSNIKFETANYHFAQFMTIVEEWLHKRATIREVKVAHRAAKSLMGKLAQLSREE